MSNTFTAQGLSDFYQKVADGGEAQLKIDEEWANLFVGGPSLGSSNAKWRIKPTKKVIDLSVLIDSQIDCEFKDDISNRTNIGKLLEITNDDSYPYTTGNSRADEYEQCQPRMNHVHAWQGGECPLPEGFRVKVWFRNTLYAPADRLATSISRWCHDGDLYDIIAFEVLGVADGYVMPWEQDNE